MKKKMKQNRTDTQNRTGILLCSQLMGAADSQKRFIRQPLNNIIGLLPFNYFIVSYAIYSVIASHTTAIHLFILCHLRHSKKFWGQIRVSDLTCIKLRSQLTIKFLCKFQTHRYDFVVLQQNLHTYCNLQ